MAADLRDIVDQMASVGIFVPAGYALKVSGKFERFRPADQKAKKKSAWYCIYEHYTRSGKVYYAGAFGIRTEKYVIKASTKDWTSEELKEAREFAKKAKLKNQQDASERAQSAAKTANYIWSHARNGVPVTFAYCVKKKITPYGAKGYRDRMVIPMYRGGLIVGMQFILPEKNEDGQNKLFLTASDTVGAYFKIGSLSTDPQQTIYVVEGYATGCSVHHATKLPVIVAFNAGNLEPVIAGIRAKMPDAKLVIAGDDDRHILIRARAFFEKFGLRPEISATSKGKVQYYTTEQYGDVKIDVGYTRINGSQAIVGTMEYSREGRRITQKLDFSNAGRIKAMAAAQKHGCCVVFPIFSKKGTGGTDFNDLEIEEGTEVIAKQLDATKLTPYEGEKKKSKNSRVSLDYLLKRYTLLYGTTDVWDHEKREVIQLEKLKPYWGKFSIDLWLDSPKRRSADLDQLIFMPTGTVPEGSINMFTGWPLKPDSSKSCHLIVEHLYYLCGKDDDVFDWVVKWLAYPLQHPGAKMHTCMLFYGAQEGTGKNMFFEDVIQRIYGDEYSVTINQQMLQDPFNGWLSHRLYCVADEVVSSADRRLLKNQIKTMITGKRHTINEKNLARRFERNFTNFVFLSNENQPLLLDEFDRRHMCVLVNTVHQPEYFKALASEIESGGVEAFYQYLLDYPLEDFCPATKPLRTRAHDELIRLGKTADRRFIEDWLAGDTDYPVGPVAIVHLYQAFKMWASMQGERFYPSQTAFGISLGHFMSSARKRVEVFAPGLDLNELKATDNFYGKVQKKQLTIYFPDVVLTDFTDMGRDEQIACYVRQFQLTMAKNLKNYRFGDY